MLHVPHSTGVGNKRASPGPLSKRNPARQPRSRRGPATVLATWDDAFILFDARIRALHLWATGVREMPSSLELDWCMACLADVRSALYQLHLGVVREKLAPPPRGPPVVSYLSEAYVWCGDVLGNVEALVQKLSGGSSDGGAGLTDDSSTYIDDFLTPLFRKMCESADRHPPPPALLPLAERLHASIISLNWVLRMA